MSRWIKLYEEHPFQAVWSEILKLKKEIKVDDATVVTSVEEIARLKKVIEFINELLKSSDPELVPEATWTNFHSQANACLQQINNYQQNRNIGHITNANANLDNLLTYIRPYQVVANKAAQSAQKSFRTYAKTINESLSTYQETSTKILSEIENLKNKAVTDANEVEKANTQIKALKTEYFEDNDSELSLSSRISNFEQELIENYENIKNYRVELLEGDSDENSISSEIKKALDESNQNSSSINSLLNSVTTKVTDFSGYYLEVFGKEDDSGEIKGGLKSEIKEREKHLDDFKLKQEKKYNAINEEIEGLLPGATSASLATAYYDLKVSFDKPIENYTKIFYGSIAILVLVALISITQEVGWFSIKFVETTDINKLFSNLLYKLPIVLPVLWVTLFASKRRSEFLRLQQEYAHKEALAKSYQSFKKQIEELNQAEPVLMEKLLDSAIDAISNNASETLDKKHGDNTPLHEGVEGLVSTLEKFKKVLGN